MTGWFRYPETISKAAQDGEQYNSFSEVSGVACEPPSQGSRLALAQPHALGQVKTQWILKSFDHLQVSTEGQTPWPGEPLAVSASHQQGDNRQSLNLKELNNETALWEDYGRLQNVSKCCIQLRW